MQRVDTLIKKLQEQFAANATAGQLLLTAQMLQAELSHTQANGAAENSGGISVDIPQIIAPAAKQEEEKTVEVLQVDEAAIEEAAKQQRKQNIQYIILAIGIVTFLILFFLLSRSIIVNEKWISFFGILGLLIVFEFINLLIHPFLERVTHHNPMLMLLALVALASLLIPLHHRVEKWIKEKMTEKNKKIRLASAKKTIEELEKK